MKRFRFLLIIAVMMTVLYVLGKLAEPPHTITVQEYDNRLVISSKSGCEIVIAYDDLHGLRFDRIMDFGTEVSGLNTRKEKSGIWKNEEFGEYFCCADGTLDFGLIVITGSQVIVFNYESEEETLRLHDILAHELTIECEG